MTWSPVSSSSESSDENTENPIFENMIQSTKPVLENFFQSHVDLDDEVQLTEKQKESLRNFEVKLKNDYIQDHDIGMNNDSENDGQKMRILGNLSSTQTETESDNDSDLEYEKLLKNNPKKNSKNNSNRKHDDDENTVKFTDFSSKKCPQARQKLYEICEKCNKSTKSTQNTKNGSTVTKNSSRRPRTSKSYKFDDYNPCTSMTDLQARLHTQKVNPCQAINELKTLNPGINVFFKNGDDNEREIAKNRSQNFDAFSTIQFCNTVLYCKKCVFEYKNETIEFWPAVDRHEKTAKNRAASICLDHIFDLQSVKYMESGESGFGFKNKGVPGSEVEMIPKNDRIDRFGRINRFGQTDTNNSTKNNRFGEDTIDIDKSQGWGAQSSNGSSYRSSTSTKSSDYDLEEMGFKRVTKSGASVRSIELECTKDFDRLLDSAMLMKIRNLMGVLKISSDEKFASVVQFDKHSGQMKIVAFAGPSEKYQFGKNSEIDQNADTSEKRYVPYASKTLNDASTICLLRRSFKRYLHENLQNYVEHLDKHGKFRQKTPDNNNIFETSIFHYNTATEKFSIDPITSFHLYYNQIPTGAIENIITDESITAEDLINHVETRTSTNKNSKLEKHLKFTDFGSQMTESDKITSWQLLGWQGAGLSPFLGNVVMRTFSIGSDIWAEKEELFDDGMFPFSIRFLYVLKIVLDRCDMNSGVDKSKTPNIAIQEKSTYEHTDNLLSNKIVVYKLRPKTNKSASNKLQNNSTEPVSGFMNLKTSVNINMSLLRTEITKYYQIYRGRNQLENNLCSRRNFRIIVKNIDLMREFAIFNQLLKIHGIAENHDLRAIEYSDFKRDHCKRYLELKNMMRLYLERQYSERDGFGKKVIKGSFKY